MWFPNLFFSWGCIPEITKGCQDIVLDAFVILGIAADAVIGGIVSWWIYNRQKKTAEIQDLALNRIKELDDRYGIEAKEFTESICPVGSNVLVDEDDGQIGAVMVE